MIFNTTIVGSGSASPRPGNLSSAQVLNYNNRLWLIDCCDGTTAELLRMGISINRIDSIFISHAHGDHCLGLPCLIATMNLNSRVTPLTVYASRQVFELLDELTDAMCGDKMNFILTRQEIDISFDASGYIFSDELLSVQALRLRHGNLETYGFKFSEMPKKRHIDMDAVRKYSIPRGAYEWIREHDWEMEDGTVIPNSELTRDPEPARVYSYISDTYAFDSLPGILEGTTTLYCEASFMEKDKELAVKFQHCTSVDAARIALETKTVKSLLIGHISSRYSEQDVLTEAKELFPSTALAVKDAVIEII